MSFRSKLILALLPFIVLSIAVISFVSYQLATSALMSVQNEFSKSIVVKTTEQVDNWITERLREGEIFSKNAILISALKGQSIQDAQSLLQDIQNHSKFYENVFLADATGKVLYDSVQGKSVGINLDKLDGKVYPNFSQAKLGKAALSQPSVSPATGLPVVLLTTPIMVGGQLIGILGTPFDLTSLYDAVLKKVKIGESGYLVLTNENGLVLAHPNKDHIMKLDLKKFEWSKIIFEKDSGRLDYEFEHMQKAGYFDLSKTTGWHIFAALPVSEVMGPVYLMKYWALGLGLGSILLIGLIIMFMTKKLFSSVEKVMSDLADNTVHIIEVAKEISSSSQNLSESSTEQASAVQETVSAVNEVSAMIEKNNDSAQRSSEISTQSADYAEEAKQVTANLIHSIHEINNSNVAISKEIESSNTQFTEIVKIITEIGDKTKMINDIVFQTKLLSFNASVEAARAGEAGKGFAVVAEEVGSLAEMSGKSAAEISRIVESGITKVRQIVDDTKSKVEIQMQEATQKVNEGIANAERCEVVLTEVVGKVNEVKIMVESISVASDEQSRGALEISKAMEQIDVVTSRNANIAQQTDGAVKRLIQQSDGLESSVETLKFVVHGSKAQQKAS